MIFVKGLFGGVLAVTLTWIVVVFVFYWSRMRAIRAQGVTGPVAIVGGWNHLLHMPVILILLTVAFGFGLYLLSR